MRLTTCDDFSCSCAQLPTSDQPSHAEVSENLLTLEDAAKRIELVRGAPNSRGSLKESGLVAELEADHRREAKT